MARRRARCRPRHRGAARAPAVEGRAAHRDRPADRRAARGSPRAPVGGRAASSCSTALRSTRYAQLLDRLVDAARDPALLPAADAPATEVLPPLARTPWKKLRRARSRSSPTIPPTSSCTRCASGPSGAGTPPRRSRPRSASPAKRFAKAVAALQDVLGDHQDAVVAATWLRDAAESSQNRDEVFVAGVLTGMIRVVEHETRARLAGGVEAGAPARRLRPMTAPEVACRGRRWCGAATRPESAEVLLVHRPRYDDWSLPEGQVRAGRVRRGLRAAARCTRRPACTWSSATRCPTSGTRTASGRPKVVRYWVMRPSDDRAPLRPERRGRRDPLVFRSTKPGSS